MRVGVRAKARLRAAWNAALAQGYLALAGRDLDMVAAFVLHRLKIKLRRRGVLCFQTRMRAFVPPRGLRLIELELEQGHVGFWAKGPQSLLAAIQRAHCELLAEEVHSA